MPCVVVDDGIVHSFWKQKVAKEPGDSGAIPGPATKMLSKKCISNREGLILYWCEGDKPSGVNYTVAVTSSDYRIVSLFLGWLKKYYNIPDERIKLRLHLWPDSDEKAAKEYWAERLGLSISSFTKSYIKDKSGKNNKRWLQNYFVAKF